MTPTPAQQLADTFMAAFEESLANYKVTISAGASAIIRKDIAAAVQDEIDRAVREALSVQQTDAQAFGISSSEGDALEVTVTSLQQCDCCLTGYLEETYGETADLHIEPPTGLN